MVDSGISREDAPSPGPAASLPPAVSLERVAFAHKGAGRGIFTDLNLSLEPGEKLFVTGPSGSGKSTLLGLVSGILKPTAGKISVGGRDLGSLTGPERDRFRGDNVGYIFQEFNLVPYLSPVENVLLPCRFSKARRERALSGHETPDDAAKDLLKRLSIPGEDFRRESKKLSVGQQQRVAAARALIGNPKLLIADEPTSALDGEIARVFLKLLLKECEERGSTLIFVSHDGSLAEGFTREFSLGNPLAVGA
jgi:putative ABC transport system ATP-binding protein